MQLAESNELLKIDFNIERDRESIPYEETKII